ncbi:MAG: NifU family protein [Deinococcota bacterium]
MLNFTDNAIARVQHYLTVQAQQGVTAVRVAGTVREPKLWLARPDDVEPTDHIFRVDDFDVFMDTVSAEQLKGATVDFMEDMMASGFRVYFPSPTWDDPLAQRVQDVLDKQVNPGVASHGGRVSLSRVEGDTAYIVLEGGCQGCGMSQVTLKEGIEVMVKEAVPEIVNIVDVTDHDSGENPYYAREDVGDSPLMS